MVVTLLALLTGCGGGPAVPPDAALPAPDASADAADAGGPDAAPLPLAVAWEPCAVRGMSGMPGECATVDVPLFWREPAGRQIPIFVKRYRQPGSRGQLWILIGGPGLSSAYLEYGLPAFSSWFASDLDIYMLDYRGVGRGTRLGCPAEESLEGTWGRDIAPSEWPACVASLEAQWGDDLAAFSTAETARDLGHLIDATRAEGERVFLYGISYGSYLGQRYLAEFPAQADGIVLEALLPPGAGLFPIAFERTHDRAGRELLERCAADPECASRLGPDPWSALGDLLDDLDAGHCPELAAAGLDRQRLSTLLGLLVQGQVERRLIPAVIHRARRCASGDVRALSHLLSLVPDPRGPSGERPEIALLDSDVLNRRLVQTELYQRPPPTAAEIDAAVAELRITVGVAADLEASAGLRGGEIDDPWAITSIPILLIQGELDAQTPREHAALFAERFAGEHQRLVVIPHAPHQASVESPVTGGGAPCGARIMGAFFRDPTGEIDLSCLDDLVPVQFFALGTAATTYFGTSDAWGDAE